MGCGGGSEDSFRSWRFCTGPRCEGFGGTLGGVCEGGGGGGKKKQTCLSPINIKYSVIRIISIGLEPYYLKNTANVQSFSLCGPQALLGPLILINVSLE